MFSSILDRLTRDHPEFELRTMIIRGFHVWRKKFWIFEFFEKFERLNNLLLIVNNK